MFRRLVKTLGISLFFVAGGFALPGCYSDHHEHHHDHDGGYYRHHHHDYHDYRGRYHDYHGYRHGR